MAAVEDSRIPMVSPVTWYDRVNGTSRVSGLTPPRLVFFFFFPPAKLVEAGRVIIVGALERCVVREFIVSVENKLKGVWGWVATCSHLPGHQSTQFHLRRNVFLMPLGGQGGYPKQPTLRIELPR